MKLIIFPRLSTRSKRAFVRFKKKYGRHYDYNPRGDLLKRLRFELQWSNEQIYDQIAKERALFAKLLS
jgi:hypothetical protein